MWNLFECFELNEFIKQSWCWRNWRGRLYLWIRSFLGSWSSTCSIVVIFCSTVRVCMFWDFLWRILHLVQSQQWHRCKAFLGVVWCNPRRGRLGKRYSSRRSSFCWRPCLFWSILGYGESVPWSHLLQSQAKGKTTIGVAMILRLMSWWSLFIFIKPSGVNFSSRSASIKSWYSQVLSAISADELCFVESSSLFGLSAKNINNQNININFLLFFIQSSTLLNLSINQ